MSLIRILYYLKSFKGSVSKPWCFIEGFNETKYPSYHKSGAITIFNIACVRRYNDHSFRSGWSGIM